MKRSLFSVFIFLIFGFNAFSQDFSNKGKDFWLCFPQHVPASGLATLSIFITSDQASSGTISMPNGAFSTSFNITANGLQEIQIPWNASIHISNAESSNETVTNILKKSIHIITDAGKPSVVAYAQQWAGARSAATLLLPVNVLGKIYYAVSFAQVGGSNQGFNSRSQFQVIATKDNTTVQITPRKNGVVGTAFTVVLPLAGDMIQYQSPDASAGSQDITGTLIESIASGSGSCLPIAVYSGSSNLTLGTTACTSSSADPLWQQLYPTSTWGKNFGFIPFGDYANGNPYRVLASEDNTSVFFDGVQVATLNAGQIYPAAFTNNPTLLATPTNITSDKPVCVTQYAQSQSCNTINIGDPDMVVLNPIEQNINDITIFSSSRQAITKNWINVLLKTNAVSSFTINGASPTGVWQPFVSLPGYSYLRNLLPGTGSFRLKADSGFNAIAYGFGNVESYAYSAGTNVKDLYQQVIIATEYGLGNSANVCTGTPFKFKVSLPYEPTSLELNFLGATNSPNPPFTNVTINPTVPDSLSTTNGKTIYWYFFSSNYTFNNVGIYPIRITINAPTAPGGCGNVQDLDFDLDVSAPPVVDFSSTSPKCFGQTVQFTDMTTSIKPTYKWNWDFGDPGSGANNNSILKNPSHNFSAPGTYTVSFSSITTAGCVSNTIQKQIVVSKIPAATVAGTATVCLNTSGTLVTFTGTNGIAPYTFNYTLNGIAQTPVVSTGNIATVTVPTNASGVFNYTLTSVSDASPAACSSSATGSAIVTVKDLPTATIAGTSATCQNGAASLVTFTGSNGATPYIFSYRINGGATQMISTTGTNTSVSVMAPTGTPGSYVYSLLSVKESSPTACINNLSPVLNITITVNPLISATVTGGVSLCLNATSPVVSFTGSNGTAPYTFNYTLNGAAQPPVMSSGNVAVLNVPTNAAGTFIYQLISVQDASSTSCVQAQNSNTSFIIYPQPAAAFTVSTTTCETQTITFNSSASTPGAGTINTYTWNFGDVASGASNTSAVANPVHLFSGAGSYNVTLTISTSNGCNSIVNTKNVTISPLPQPGFILPEVCLLDPFAKFTDTSKIAAPGTITGWQWNFGDPASGPLNTSNVQNAQHKYNAVGTYNVQLMVTSNAGCTNSITKPLTINGGNPQSNFVTANAANCANDSVGIINKSTIASGNITRLEIYWDNTGQPAAFEFDEDPLFNKVYRHKYPDFQSPLSKTYNVRVRAFSGGVCFNDKIIAITINASPKVQFNAIPDACYNQSPFQITQASEIGGVPGIAIFSGPGISSSGIFTPAGQATGVPLTIKYKFTSTAGGCVDSASQTITLLDTASARFSVSAPVCENSTTSFTDLSTAPAGIILQNTVWDFGDGSAPENHTPRSTFTHSFPGTGTFIVKMYNTSTNGCQSATETISVIVRPVPRPTFTFDKTDYCVPNAVVSFNSSGSTIADGTQNTFTYIWNFGDPGSGSANTSTASTPTHTYTTAGSYTINLQIRSGAGCVHDTSIILDRLHPQPVASFDFGKAAICVDQDAVFTDRSTGADGTLTNFAWDFGDNSGTSALQNPPPYHYNGPGAYKVKLQVTNSLGCMQDTTKTINVNDYPLVDAGERRFVLEGGSVTLQPNVTAVQPQYLWSWNVSDPTGFLNNPRIKNPVSSPLSDVLYTLTVNGAGNCASSDTVFIKLLKGPRIPNTFSPNNDGINDFWVIKYLDTYPNARVQVFTRTGQLVFESRGYPQPWDGNTNGKSLPVDTYYYVIEPENGRAPLTGYVTIIK